VERTRGGLYCKAKERTGDDTDREVETLIGQRRHVAGDLMIASPIGINYKEPAANSRRLLLVRLGRSWILSVLPSADVGEKAGQEDRGDACPALTRDGKAGARRTTDGAGQRGASATTCTGCARNEKAVTVRTVTAELLPKQTFELPEAEATVEPKPGNSDIRKGTWPHGWPGSCIQLSRPRSKNQAKEQHESRPQSPQGTWFRHVHLYIYIVHEWAKIAANGCAQRNSGRGSRRFHGITKETPAALTRGIDWNRWVIPPTDNKTLRKRATAII
jgi:hypothetical protein